jgi:hypothetical protein
LTLLLVAKVHFMWMIFAHTTPDERACLHDSMDASMGIAWRSLGSETLQRALIVGKRWSAKSPGSLRRPKGMEVT